MYTEQSIRNLKPIGSVIKLKNADKLVMVIGVCQRDITVAEKEYDYTGVMYPEGNIGAGSQFFFNEDDIDCVVYEGYRNEQWEQLIGNIVTYYGKKALADSP